TPAQAGTAMAGAGFRSVSAVCQADPAATPEGSVTAQEPAGGTGARPETPVTLTVTRRAC
ncbi:MAG: PASTA domain-containing protein, partial [Naasia sp.]